MPPAGRRPPAATARASPTTTTMAISISSSPGTAATSSTAMTGAGKFTDVAAAMDVAGGALATPSRWGDFDNDGRIDVYVSSYIDKPVNERDFLFHNEGARFVDVIPENIAKRGATHGIQWVDFDKDGDLDFSIANNNPNGTHSLYRNLLPPEQARRSIQVLVQDAQGPGDESGLRGAGLCRGHSQAPRRWASSTPAAATRLRTSCPVHLGLGTDGAVDVEVTTFGKGGRKVKKIAEGEP